MNNLKSIKIIPSRGFTLIEILVALVLLSMILLLLFSSLFTAIKYWQVGENSIEKNDEIRLASHFIRQQISQSVPILWVDKDEEKLLFQGESDKLFFTSTLPSYRGGGGIHTLTLKVIQTDDESQLGMAYSLLTPDNLPFQEGTDKNAQFVAIVSNIDSIRFSYYGKEKNDEEAKWFDIWKNNDFLPQLVRIKINMLDTSRKWPVLDIPVKANYVKGLPEFTIRASAS